MEESKFRSSQFGNPSLHNAITSNYGLISSNFGTFGMNSESSSFQALALEHQSSQVAVSASKSSDFSMSASSEDLLFNTFRQLPNALAQQNNKKASQKVLLPKLVAQRKTVELPLTNIQCTSGSAPKDLLYNPFRLKKTSNNVAQQIAKQPPQKALQPPTPLVQTVGPSLASVAQAVEPLPTPLKQCTLTSGGGSSCQRKRKLQQCNAIDSPILRAQMGPEIVQSMHLPNRKRGTNPPSDPYHYVPNRHEYCNLFEKITKGDHDIKKCPQYIKFLELSLDKQINQVITFQLLTTEERRIQWQLVHDTLSNLREYEPQCEVYGFGSLITGFKSYSYLPAFQTVDLEFSVAFRPNSSHVSVEVILNALVDCAYSFQNLKKCQIANVIKLRHNRSKLTCELSFQGRLPKHDTSMLIKYCMSVSTEIRAFLTVLRHWAMVHQIIGNDHNNLSEYTIFMLGLVYLMETRRQVQPVNVLVAKDIIKSTMINSTTIVSNQSEVVSEVNADFGQVVIEMMSEFCDKYAKLDFSSVVISPYTGEIIPREWFLSGNHSRLPQTLQNVQANWLELSLDSPICVQDPYVLEGSICWDRNKKATERLKNKCLQTYNILLNKEKEDFKLLDLFMPNCEKDQKSASLTGDMDTRDITANCNKNVCSKPRKVESALGRGKPVMEKINRRWKRKVSENNNIAVAVQTKTKLAFSIDGVFVKFYLQAICGSKILEDLSRDLLKNKIFTLWKDFSVDFFNEMITDGLKLYVSSDPNGKEIRVTYPFWQGRAELIGYGEKNPIEVEKKQSNVIIKYFETSKQGSNDADESKQDAFLQFVIPVTVDVKNKNKVPTLEINLQDFSHQKCSNGNSTAIESNSRSAIQCISRILKRSFTLYQTYKIKRHFQ